MHVLPRIMLNMIEYRVIKNIFQTNSILVKVTCPMSTARKEITLLQALRLVLYQIIYAQQSSRSPPFSMMLAQSDLIRDPSQHPHWKLPLGLEALHW